MIKKIVKKTKEVIHGKWEVRKQLWPYNEGWATYHTGKRMALDMDIENKEDAQKLCDQYNGEEPTTETLFSKLLGSKKSLEDQLF